jgi:small multidrug resistance family-3 protein
MALTRSIALFIAAGLAEIGGGYLVWRWLREGAGWPVGVFGAVVLVVYGVIPTLQPPTANFGRVYAAYGGVFVIMSLLWGWGVDGHRPDRYDWLGAAIVVVGVAVIFFSPRHA